MLNEALCVNHSLINILITSNYLFDKYLHSIRLVNVTTGVNMQVLKLKSFVQKDYSVILAKLPVQITTQYDSKDIFTNNLLMYIDSEYSRNYIHFCHFNDFIYYTRYNATNDSQPTRVHISSVRYNNTMALQSILLSATIDNTILSGKFITDNLYWMCAYKYIEDLLEETPLKHPSISEIGVSL